jgi:hypothetical protein
MIRRFNTFTTVPNRIRKERGDDEKATSYSGAFFTGDSGLYSEQIIFNCNRISQRGCLSPKMISTLLCGKGSKGLVKTYPILGLQTKIASLLRNRPPRSPETLPTSLCGENRRADQMITVKTWSGSIIIFGNTLTLGPSKILNQKPPP